MPWRDQVGALLIGYFGRQEFGNALADAISGAAEPGGWLPTTWFATEQDMPILNVNPDAQSRLHGAEGMFDSVDGPFQAAAAELILATVILSNVWARPGRRLVRVYAEMTDSALSGL